MTDSLPIWTALRDDYSRLSAQHVIDLYEAAPTRESDYRVGLADGFTLYYGRNLIDDMAHAHLLDLAKAAEVAAKRDRMAAGAPINASENRAVLHMALRAPEGAKFAVGGVDVMADVLAMRKRLKSFTDAVHAQNTITDIVHIGIGGSELGPRMACKALSAHAKPGMRVHFAGNADGAVLAGLLPQLDPAATLVLIASKTFTTDETMSNARIVRQWLVDHLGETNLAAHLVALSSNTEATAAFGIAHENVFPFADWVGGRFSVWSSIGLPIALYCGFDQFEMLLQGAASMDSHFLSAPLERNIPVIHALCAVWNSSICSHAATAILPYADHLRDLPAYLQQLMMESNGKAVTVDGQPVPVSTSPVIFGAAGTDCQHSFMQMLHQGGDDIPCDLIGFLAADHAYPAMHCKLLANLLAQAQALLQGRDHDDPRQRMPGSRPHNLIFLPRLNAFTLGQLLAMYEHSTAVQGFIWNINSFDQPGVELGKVIARSLEGQIPLRDLHIADIDALLASEIA